MRHEQTIAVIIPALNEENAIGQVLDAIPAWVDDVVVVDNGSTDRTADVAAERGAQVVSEPVRGYGAACLKGLAALRAPDVVVFLDGDYSDHPEEMPLLVDPVLRGDVDLMIGSRVRGEREHGALTPQAAFGNWLATRLIRVFWGIRYTDLGPFRAIRYRTLLQLDMRDRGYGWTAEMQIKAALQAVPADETPVSYRRRTGTSKVSGTLGGVVGAGYKILATIFLSALFARPALKTALIVYFTRVPEPGVTKTRLIPALGPEGAADLQRAMTEHTLAVSPPPLRDVDVQVRYTGDERAAVRAWLGPDYLYAPQGDGDLGERIARAFEEGFGQAYGKVVICGSDCPNLDSARTMAAFEALDRADLVVGPAEDGGYYLIGLSIQGAPEEMHALFEGVAWGGGEVRETTLANAARLDVAVEELPMEADVDMPEDLGHWEEARARNRISIVVPVLNEANTLGPLLDSLREVPDAEVIVVDGGSDDGSPAIARSRGAEVMAATRGRGSQMNAGAARATGNLLLFLHADARLPRNFDVWVRRTLAFDDVALGAFSLRIDAPGRGYRFLSRAANLRSVWLNTPYGDQGLFLRREVFEAAGGFPELPLLEDYALVRAVRQAGAVVTLPLETAVSARRWKREGAVRVTIKNIAAFIAFPLGVSAERIAAWYGRP